MNSLEMENLMLKEHEEFYIDKAREWNGRVSKYEKTLEKNVIKVPGKEKSEEEEATTEWQQEHNSE